MITAGGTSELIDDVRKITNIGTGKLGSLIADEFSMVSRVNRILYICAKGSVHPLSKKITCIEIESVAELYDKIIKTVKEYSIHVVIHSMAVSDYIVKSISTIEGLASFLESHATGINNLKEVIECGMNETNLRNGSRKLSSQMDSPLVLLKSAPKILPLFREVLPEAVIVGFKLLSHVCKDELFNTAHRLLIKNRCDFVIANDSSEIDGDNHRGYLIDSKRNVQKFQTKYEIANGIVTKILKGETE